MTKMDSLETIAFCGQELGLYCKLNDLMKDAKPVLTRFCMCLGLY